MKNSFVFLMVSFCIAASGFGQRVGPAVPDESVLAVRIQKQIACAELERQIKDTPVTAVRVFARLRVATWLWASGRDDTDRAEDFAVLAMQDLHDNSSEVPPLYFRRFESALITLLDRNSNELAKKLREKYKITGELEGGNYLPASTGSERDLVNAAIRSLRNSSELDAEIVPLIITLRSRNHPDLLRLLTAVIQVTEAGRGGMSNAQVYMLSHQFIIPQVPADLQKRFLKIVVDRCRAAAQNPKANIDNLPDLMARLIPKIESQLPDLYPEMSVIQAILKTRLSAEARASGERYDRISKSSDKFAAFVKEAEDASDNAVKYEMYVAAAQFALKQPKLADALRILDKTDELDFSHAEIDKDFRARWRSSFLVDLAEAALKENDHVTAEAAIKRIDASLVKAEMVRKLTVYHVNRGDLVSAKESSTETVKLATKGEVSSNSISILLRLLPVAQKIDPSGILDLNRTISKALNSISPPKSDFQSNRTQHYEYLTGLVDTNWNLLPVLLSLSKVDRAASLDLVSRIEKREYRLIADLAILFSSFEQAPPRIAQ